jgi:RNA polymerase sigma-70 factor (ECF subfamily)
MYYELAKFLYSRYPQGSKDILQDIYLDIYSGKIKPPSQEQSTRPYLYSVCRNYLSNKKRKALFLSVDYYDFCWLPQVPENDQNQAIEAAEALLNSALLALPEDQRQCLILSKLESYTYEEIAQMMDISRDSVKRLITKAKEFVEHYLRNHGYQTEV